MHNSWKPFLTAEFQKPYFQELSHFLHTAYATRLIFPKKSDVFRAFSTNLTEVKVVILGQDPYHTPGAAMGLAFSVPEDQPIPPSLRNIYQEIRHDLGRPSICEPYGNLQKWQNQGVLLLNTVLTVEAHQAASHRGRGWEIFTTEVIKYLNQNCNHLVFILWGSDARSKKSLIDTQKHLVLESPHPSPLSAHRGFFHNHHFSQTNSFLKKHGITEINW